jgi:PAS domain-containing protein
MRVACPKFMRGRSLEVFGKFNHAFYAVDRRWRFTYANRRAQELWGRSKEELLRKNTRRRAQADGGGDV